MTRVTPELTGTGDMESASALLEKAPMDSAPTMPRTEKNFLMG
jgi:hypothetical protein